MQFPRKAVALIIIILVFFLGYKTFYHHGYSIIRSSLLKAFLYGVWMFTVYLAGIFGLENEAPLMRKYWTVIYYAAAVCLIAALVLQWLLPTELISESAAELRLFFSSPLPFGCLLILRRLLVSANDQGS